MSGLYRHYQGLDREALDKFRYFTEKSDTVAKVEIKWFLSSVLFEFGSKSDMKSFDKAIEDYMAGGDL
jgi:hypothetical protein